MEKLLHERLRESNSGKCPGSKIAVVIGCEKPECSDITCSSCAEEIMRKLGDEIYRQYIPRPRFEDGEPVQGGNEFDKGYAHFAVIDLHHPNCYWLLEDYDGCLTEAPIKRPQPKDSLEKLIDDVTKPQRQYYKEYIGNDVCLRDDEEINVAVHTHIINRAMKLK